MFSVYLSVMRPGGIGETHFRIPRDELQAKRNSMRYLWLPLLPSSCCRPGRWWNPPPWQRRDRPGPDHAVAGADRLPGAAHLPRPHKGEASMLQTLTAVVPGAGAGGAHGAGGPGYYYYTALKLTGCPTSPSTLLI